MRKAILAFGAMSVCVAVHAQTTAGGTVPAPGATDREWKLEALALQVESRALASCSGHNLSAGNWKVCMDELRIPGEAGRVASIAASALPT